MVFIICRPQNNHHGGGGDSRDDLEERSIYGTPQSRATPRRKRTTFTSNQRIDFMLVWSSSSKSRLRKNKARMPPKLSAEDAITELERAASAAAPEDETTASMNARKRDVFERNLEKEGLLLEYLPAEKSGLNFVKIHAPETVLKRYAEILKLRLPMRKVRCDFES